MTNVSVRLPTEVVDEAERRLAHPNESRGELVARLLREALQAQDERDLDQQYARGYECDPPTDDERAFVLGASNALGRLAADA